MDLPTLLTSIGSSLTLAAIGGLLARSRVAKNIRQDLARDYAQRLEEHRSALSLAMERQLEARQAELRAQVESGLHRVRDQMAEARAIQAVATSAMTSAHAAVAERRLRAIEELWRTILKTRTRVNDMVWTLDALPPGELAEVHEAPRFQHVVEGLDWEALQSLSESLDKLPSDPEEWRPFIGDVLWAHFHGYRAFLFRVAAHYVMTFQREGRLTHWPDDPMARGLLTALLTDPELRHVEESETGRLRRAQFVIEARLIRTAEEVISGQSAAEESLTRAHHINELVAELSASTRMET